MTAERFVGRERELAQLQALLRSTAAGARMIVVSGEPGIGKTRLLAEFRRRNATTPFLVGRGSPMSRALPFSTLAEAIESHLRQLEGGSLLELVGTRASLLATILPSIAAARPAAIDHQAERLAVFDALSRLLGTLSAAAPVVVVLDDVHQADPSTWDALSYIGRNPPSGRLLMALTVRPAELADQPQLSTTVGLLLKDGLADEMRLGPLDAVAMAALVESSLAGPDPEVAAWLETRTRGNPLYALALLDDLRANRRQRVVPVSVTERVRLLASALPTSAREVLDLASVLGHAFAASWLMRLSPDCSQDFDLLVQHGWLAENARGDPELFDFAHPVVQEAVYALIGPARRRELHTRVARAGGLDLARRAYHAARGALPGEAWAVELLRAAARDAEAAQAHREALEHLANALKLLQEDEVGARIEVLDEIAWQASSCGDHVAGVKALNELEGILPNDPELHAKNHIRLASFLSTGAGDLKAAAAHASAAIDLLAGERSGSLASAVNELAWVRGEAGDLAEQIELSRSAIPIAADAGDSVAEMHALGALGHALGIAGRTDEAVEVLERSLRLAQTAGDRAQVGWHAGSLADALLHGGRSQEAARGLDLLLAEPNPSDVPYFTRALVNWFSGNWEAALDDCFTVRSLNPSNPSIHSAWTLSLAAQLLVATKRDAEASVLRLEAERIYLGRPFYCFSARHDWAIGLMDWSLGELERGRERLEGAYRRLVKMGAQAEARMIHPDVAGIARALEGRPEVDTVEQALAEPVQYRRARCLESLAPRLPLAAQVEVLQEAARLYASLPAPRLHERVLKFMRTIGPVGIRSARRVGELTARELAVAKLAAGGLTAREIGQRLHVSTRTAESHLAHTYAKLSINGRAELQARLAEITG